MTSVMTAMLRTVFPAAGCGGAAAAGVGAAAAADGEARGALEEAAIWRRGMRERKRAVVRATGALVVNTGYPTEMCKADTRAV